MDELRSEISSRSTSQKKYRTTRLKKDGIVLTDLKFALYILFCFLH
ncbi:hypothetical protein kam1_718 [Methylacidiphilum kamchatkense Kam1]|uniref:Uncharacterized protein n=1 Tax=Methylacidiphilum kamchatkense Kam1 TaxID=1202785 RepID=A0A516TLB8_9BACT|nr:hypothetical protein kam1_718 [Methylacidiphilum kamchatkense Kam1]